MKKLTLLLFLLPTITSAQDMGYASRAPEKKVEIGITAGRGLDLENNFVVFGKPLQRIFFNDAVVYVNFSRFQVGVGVESQFSKFIDAPASVRNDPRFENFTPHFRLNITHEATDVAFYAGLMGGYHIVNPLDNSFYSIRGNGVTGGIQGGVLFKLTHFLALNGEIAGRVSEVKYTYTYAPGVFPGNRSTYQLGRSYFQGIFKLGIRFRI